ncbi:MAG: ATP-grasp domain-containing protein [Candidatus Omnitrophota bacterium]|nr:ATP-grasp domain-containing protein [Candidatus Omnitrophota bacterium]
MPLRIGLTFDLKPKDSPGDFLAEHDSEETISLIENALKNHGHKVIRIGSVKELLKKLRALNCDIVFNIAEGINGRNREAEVPAILEAFGIPYVGSDTLTLSVSLDKIISKKIFAYHDIPTPPYFECTNKKDIIVPKGFSFPLIVKPRHEGSAKGIEPDSKVNDFKAFRKKVKRIIEDYRQPALVEEFISGWEFTVGIIGNENPEVLPVVQRHVESRTGLSSHIFEKAGINKDYLKYRDFLEIEPELESQIKDYALTAFRGLDCRDFTRLDFRVNERLSSRKKLKIYLLEINPLPSLAKDDYFAMVAELSGISYDEMVNRILDAAVKRYKCR